ncbi:hypothetical protein D3C76_812550 [compost metagenome]
MAISGSELDHLALTGHHVGHAGHFGEQAVYDSPRNLGFVFGACRKVVEFFCCKALHYPPAQACHKCQPDDHNA